MSSEMMMMMVVMVSIQLACLAGNAGKFLKIVYVIALTRANPPLFFGWIWKIIKIKHKHKPPHTPRNLDINQIDFRRKKFRLSRSLSRRERYPGSCPPHPSLVWTME